MRVTYTYECEVCGEFERIIYDSPEDAPVRMTCTVCGCTNTMVKRQPRVPIHNKMRRRR